MLNLVISSFASTIIILSSGILFQYLFLKNDTGKLKLFESGIFGCIFLAFISLFLNFFFPINKLIGNIILVVSLIIFLLIFYKNRNKKELVLIIASVTIITILLVFSSNIYRPDAGLYHFPYISLLHEDKINLGISNIHHRFGHISIMQYLSAIFHNNIFKLEFFNLPLASLFSFYFLLLIKICFTNFNTNQNNKIFIFFITIFSFYAFGRYSNYGNDAPAHLFFFLSIIYILDTKNNNFYDLDNFFKILLFTIFCFLNKNFMIITLILPIIYFFKSEKIKLFFSLLLSKKNFFCYFFLICWILKNLLSSGCVLYPISSTCIKSLSHTDIEKTNSVALEGKVWAKSINNIKNTNISRQDYTKNFNWFNNWSKTHFKIIKEKIIPFLIFLIIYFIIYFFISLKNRNYKKIEKNYLKILITFLFFCLFWFLNFPLYRFGMSFIVITIICVCCILLNIINHKNTDKLKRVHIFFIALGILGLFIKNITRVYNVDNKNYANYPWPKIYTLSDQGQNTMQTKDRIFDENNNFIYYYSNIECMYGNAPCSNYLYTNIKLKRKYSYKIFYVN